MSELQEIDLNIASGIGKYVFFLNTVDSTNDYLKRYAEDFSHGTVLWAEEQTAGRGRGSNRWASPAAKGLYFSILLKPKEKIDNIQLLSLMSSLALKKSVEEFALERNFQPRIIDIKWPNDLLWQNKKFAGILIENIVQDEKFVIVVGIGLNMTSKSSDFPAEFKHEVCSLEQVYKVQFEQKELLKRILLNFEDYYRNFNPAKIVEDYISNCAIWGKEGIVHTAYGVIKGVCHGITPRGELIIITAEGEKTIINGTLRVSDE